MIILRPWPNDTFLEISLVAQKPYEPLNHLVRKASCTFPDEPRSTCQLPLMHGHRWRKRRYMLTVIIPDLQTLELILVLLV